MAKSVMRVALAAGAMICALALPIRNANAWGDEGHEVVALIAYHFLDPSVKLKVDALLASDTDTLTKHDIASEATWADKYREHARQTAKWHYVDIEIDDPNIDAACFGHPPIPAGTPASTGSANDCVLDKINQFSIELASKSVSPEERLVALKFLLHFVGDLHQPLHSSDNHDAGGNRVEVKASGFKGKNLHAFWDTEVVENLGDDPSGIAADLVGGIDQSKGREKMAAGSPNDWAMEAYGLAKTRAYGELPPANAEGIHVITATYETDAIETARIQLARAGVRLAGILNRALAD